MVESLIAINHGALGKCTIYFVVYFCLSHISKGVVSWEDPTTPEIKSFASRLALSMPNITLFILNPYATFRQTTILGVDFGIWKINTTETLVLATNTKYSPVTVPLARLDLPSSGINVEQILDTGATGNSENIVFESVGSGAFVIN